MLAFLLSITAEGDEDKVAYLYITYQQDMLRFAESRLRRMNVGDPYRDAEDAV